MYDASADDGFNKVRKAEKIRGHEFTIKSNGQLVFNRAFWASKLISKEETTFFEVLWNPGTEELRIVFSNEADMEAKDSEFDPENQEDPKDAYRLNPGDLQKGLIDAIRVDCSPHLVPDQRHWVKWREGIDLTYNVDLQYMTVQGKDKVQEPDSKLQKEIDDGKTESKAYAKSVRMLNEHDADPKSFMDKVEKGKYTSGEVEGFIELKEQFEIIKN